MGRRVILLCAAALVAAVGAGLVFIYATGGGSSASASNQTVSVYRATATITPGTTGASLGAETVENTAVSTDLVPSGAITNLSDVASLKAITTIFPGQVLISAQFAPNVTTGGLPIPAGKLAVAVSLTDPQRVAGFVQPGSKVSVFASRDNKTELLLSGVTVIAVGPSTMTTQTTTSGDSTSTVDKAQAPLTLALSPTEATSLVNATNGGQVYLGLQGAS